MAVAEELYHPDIIALAALLPREARLADPQVSVFQDSPLCGSRLWLDLSLDDEDRVVGFGHKTRACLLGKAATQMLSQSIVGMHADEVIALRDQMRRMLQSEDSLPEGEFAQFALFVPARAYKARHGSLMLCFEAAVTAIESIRNGEVSDTMSQKTASIGC